MIQTSFKISVISCVQTECSLYEVETVECSFQNPVVVTGSLQAINQKYEDAKMSNMKGWKNHIKWIPEIA